MILHPKCRILAEKRKFIWFFRAGCDSGADSRVWMGEEFIPGREAREFIMRRELALYIDYTGFFVAMYPEGAAGGRSCRY